MLFFYAALFVWTQEKRHRSTSTTGTILFRRVELFETALVH